MVLIEVYFSSPYLGREIAKLDHDVQVIPAQYVIAFVEVKAWP
jgi:hypothetical protein